MMVKPLHAAVALQQWDARGGRQTLHVEQYLSGSSDPELRVQV
eukprot:CAMPEP_0119115484 /NCGR_PEP_ID=MMETSP1180-20130426/51130_1 /TAXON_ID=3052 ORGANISM="Chlamydomonas cf sp, Strain CCMP681" /NCGR_SAMPLE_ID=MMETSP1180 /ASSEMBLY_ACC=CAM_ASM_000741 /LENGTH=42 /DNA_ID= /DNA_START= /DNA_END= /DNA_ORIENTATION=